MKNYVCPSQLKILEAVMQMKAAGEHITLRSIARKLGYRGCNYVYTAMMKLRQKGLISFNEHQAGTIQPRVRFIPASEL